MAAKAGVHVQKTPELMLHLFNFDCIARSLNAGRVNHFPYAVQRQKTSPLKAVNGQRSLLPMKDSVQQQNFGNVLLLVEEVDVILDADRGFHSAVVNLMKTTKVGFCCSWWLSDGFLPTKHAQSLAATWVAA